MPKKTLTLKKDRKNMHVLWESLHWRPTLKILQKMRIKANNSTKCRKEEEICCVFIGKNVMVHIFAHLLNNIAGYLKL